MCATLPRFKVLMEAFFGLVLVFFIVSNCFSLFSILDYVGLVKLFLFVVSMCYLFALCFLSS